MFQRALRMAKQKSDEPYRGAVFPHLVHGAGGVDGAHLAMFLVLLDDWSRRVQVGLDSA